MTNTAVKPIMHGVLASAALLGVYFSLLTLISGWPFAQSQFGQYWYFIVTLAVGFGMQIALYQYIKTLVHSGAGMGTVVGVSGTTSTAAMVSCCAHYLVNLLPILGVTGFVTFVAAYQVQLFWVGILFNLAGIAYMSSRMYQIRSHIV